LKHELTPALKQYFLRLMANSADGSTVVLFGFSFISLVINADNYNYKRQDTDVIVKFLLRREMLDFWKTAKDDKALTSVCFYWWVLGFLAGQCSLVHGQWM